MENIVRDIIKSRGCEGMAKPLLLAAVNAVANTCEHNPFNTEPAPLPREERGFLLRYESICDSSSVDFIKADVLTDIWNKHNAEVLAYAENVHAIGGRSSAIKTVSQLVLRVNNKDKPYYSYKQIEDALYKNMGALAADIQQLSVAFVIDKVANTYKRMKN